LPAAKFSEWLETTEWRAGVSPAGHAAVPAAGETPA